MIYLLILLLLTEAFIFYQLNGREILSPSLVSVGSFLIASIVYGTHLESYGKDLEPFTVAIVTSYTGFIFWGELFANLFLVKKSGNDLMLAKNLECIHLSKRKIYFVTLFVLAVSLGYFYMVYQQSLVLGNASGDLLTMTKYVRSAQLNQEEIEGNRFLSHGCVLAQVLVYYFIYAFLRNKYAGITDYRLLLPVFAFVPYILANNARTHIMLIIAVVFVIWYVLYAHHAGWGKVRLCSVIKKAMIFLFVLIIAFWGLGFRKGQSSIDTVDSNLTIYISFGLYGLDHFLLYGEKDDILPMQTTLDSVYSFLRNKGFDIAYFDHHGIFISCAQYEANTYSVCKPLVKQYGYLGGVIEMFIWGFLFSCIRNKIRHTSDNFVLTVVLGNLMYPLAMSAIGYQHYYTISTNFVYCVVYAWIISKYFPRVYLRCF